jgi:hypothetical protein
MLDTITEGREWQYVVMTSDRSDIEVAGFVTDLTREYMDEIVQGKVAHYSVYRGNDDGGDHIILIPPETSLLTERMKNWKSRVKPCTAAPNLIGFSQVPIQ